jgi:uncharacterized membrane protein YdjX (TVP38/TMEM64 family)
MSNTVARKKPAAVLKQWLRRNYASILVLLFVVAIVVGIFVFYQRYPDKFRQFENYGYLGAFLICLVTNASVILPVPGLILLFPLGVAFNPVFVGLSGGTGGTIGEMSCYLLGFSGRTLVENRRFYDEATRWLKRWGSLTVFVFAITPLPFDVLGIAAGLLRYPFWKFFIACWLGKVVLYIGMALAGRWGWQAYLSGMLFRSPISLGLLAAGVTVALVLLALVLENQTWKHHR